MCYQCSKCNVCGRFSRHAVVLCNTCDAVVPNGADKCPNCGTPTTGNLHAKFITIDSAVETMQPKGPEE